MYLSAFLFLSHFLVGPGPLLFFFSSFLFPCGPAQPTLFFSPARPSQAAFLLPFSSRAAQQPPRPILPARPALPPFPLSLADGWVPPIGPVPFPRPDRTQTRVRPRSGAAPPRAALGPHAQATSRLYLSAPCPSSSSPSRSRRLRPRNPSAEASTAAIAVVPPELAAPPLHYSPPSNKRRRSTAVG
jgi:hypothetical protein